MRFLCDEMLRRLARWLRAAGYDTMEARPGTPDRELLVLARTAGRLLLTCDRALLRHRDAAGTVVLLDGSGTLEQARDLARQVQVDWMRAPMTRCLICNAVLQPASPEQRAATPPGIQARGLPITFCPACEKLYWPGGHERRLRETLAQLPGRPR